MAIQRNGTGTSAEFAEKNGNTPVGPTDLVNKAYADAVTAVGSAKTSVQAATTAPLPANAYSNGVAGVGATLTKTVPFATLPAQDGVTLAVNDRVLVKDEVDPKTNGIYVVTSVGSGAAAWVLTRASDANSAAKLATGIVTFVVSGTANGASAYEMTTTGIIIVGTSSIVWTLAGSVAFVPKSAVVGTSGRLAKFGASNALGNSILEESGGNIIQPSVDLGAALGSAAKRISAIVAASSVALYGAASDAQPKMSLDQNSLNFGPGGATPTNWQLVVGGGVAVVSTGGKIQQIDAPTAGPDLTNKTYVDALAQGLSPKGSVVAATAAVLAAYTYANGTLGVGATITFTLAGAQTVDGVVPALGERVLVKNETAGNAPNNGIYLVTVKGTGILQEVWTRTLDNNEAGDFPGAFVFCESGTVNVGAGFVCTNVAPVVVGTTPIVWTQFSGAGEITAGNGLAKSANTLSVLANGATIDVSASGIKVADNVFIRADGTVAMAAALNLGTHLINGVVDPVSAQDADTKAARDAAIAAAVAALPSWPSKRCWATAAPGFANTNAALSGNAGFQFTVSSGIPTGQFTTALNGFMFDGEVASGSTMAGVLTSPATGASLQKRCLIEVECQILMPATTAGGRHWIGFSPSDPSASDTIPNNAFMFRWRDTVDTNFRCQAASNGGTVTDLDSGIPPVADTLFTLKIIVLANGNIQYYINGTLVQTITTNLPTDTTGLTAGGGYWYRKVSAGNGHGRFSFVRFQSN